MTVVEYHADLKEVQRDSALSALLSPEHASTPFDRLKWWQGLAEHCDLSPMLAVARSGDEAAVLPLCNGNGSFSSLSNWYTFRYRPVISANGAALLEPLARDLAHRARRITLSGLPDEDGSASALETAFQSAGWLVKREECDTNHVLLVNDRDYDTYHASLPGRLRTTLKRKSSKVDCRVLTHFDGDVWNDYEAIYGESWKPEEGFPAFLRAFAEAEGAAGRLRLGIAHHNGEAVAAQMWSVEGGTAFIHKLAHREEAKAVSPGSVLSAALFCHAIDVDKVALIDFGTGDDPYKRDWMEEVRPRYRLDMFRPFAPQNWLIFAKSGLQSLVGRSKRG